VGLLLLAVIRLAAMSIDSHLHTPVLHSSTRILYCYYSTQWFDGSMAGKGGRWVLSQGWCVATIATPALALVVVLVDRSAANASGAGILIEPTISTLESVACSLSSKHDLFKIVYCIILASWQAWSSHRKAKSPRTASTNRTQREYHTMEVMQRLHSQHSSLLNQRTVPSALHTEALLS
jgi:hypothetical protein